MPSLTLTRSFASASASALPGSKLSTAGPSSSRKIVLVGAGFLASYIARALVADPRNRVLLVSRNPQAMYDKLSHLGSQILPPHSGDVTRPDTLQPALKDASAVVSLVGVLVGTAKKFEKLQKEGAENVARIAKEEGVGRCVMISAMGADELGATPYWRTKGQAERAFLEANPESTIIRPSIVFGPGDSFFNRFKALAGWLPFLPVFGGGLVRFQPVYAGDIARAVEICCRDDPKVVETVGGKVIEAGGPEVFSYREIMKLVLKYAQMTRPVISLPYWVGMIQGFFLEKLPENMFTVTRDQITQLRSDNIVSPAPPLNSISFSGLLSAFPASLPSSRPPSAGDADLTSVHKILPTYLGPPGTGLEKGKRTHGRGSAVDAFEEVQRMAKKDK